MRLYFILFLLVASSLRLISDVGAAERAKLIHIAALTDSWDIHQAW
jgi:hypothetical protein